MLTFENKAHLRVLVLGLLVVPSEYGNLAFVEPGPPAAAEQTKLPFDVVDCGVYFAPEIRLDVVNLDVVAVHPLDIDASELY